MLKLVLDLLRVSHWIKNLIVFALPLSDSRLFGINFTLLSWTNGVLLFLSLSLVSSSNYIVNDILDRDYDVKHPSKKSRPIASKRISIKIALIVSIICLFMGLCLSLTISPMNFLLVLLFFLLQLFYSATVKNLAIVEILWLSFLYALRSYLPYSYEDIQFSVWFTLQFFFV
jgi:4-hydroxybenzoate polyprenyltransferase